MSVLTRAALRLLLAFALVCAQFGLAPLAHALSDMSAAGSITALNGTAVFAPQGRQTISCVLSGTWSATVIAEVSSDGSTWEGTDIYDVSGRARAASTTSNGTYVILGTAGVGAVRVKASAYTSGTVTVTFRGTDSASGLGIADVASSAPGSSAYGLVVRSIAGTGSSATEVQGTTASGSVSTDKPVLIGGQKSGGGTVQTVQVNPNGVIAVALDASSSVIGAVTQGASGSYANAWGVQGTALEGSAIAGAPNLAGLKDTAGTARALKGSPNGDLFVTLQASSSTVGAVTQASGPWTVIGTSTGSVGSANGLLITGRDSAGNAMPAKTDTTGTFQVDIESSPTAASSIQVQGAGADGSTAVGNPEQVAGKDSAGNAQTLATGLDGSLYVVLQASTSAIGTVTSVGPAADGAAVSGNPNRIAGKDSSGNTQDVVTGLDGSLYVALQASSSVIGAVTQSGTWTATAPSTGSIGTASAFPMGAVNPSGAVVIPKAGADSSLFVTLQASTSAIGKLAANSGVDIGDVDVTSIVMPTGASAAQVQGTVADGSTAAQNPVQSAGKDASGNIQTLATGLDGSLYVVLQASSSVIGAVTQSGTWTATAPSTGSIGTASAFPMGAVNPSGAVVIPKAGADSSLFVTLQASSSAIGKLAANSGVDIGDVDITSISAGDNNIGNVDIVTLPAITQGASTSLPWPVNLTNASGTSVTVTSNRLVVDGSGVTQPVSGTVTANAGTGTFTTGGAAADGAAVSGNPVRAAGKDSAGNTQDLVTGLDGSLYVVLQASSSVIGAVTQSGTWTATAPSTGSIGTASAFPMGAVNPSGAVVIPKTGTDSSLFVTLQASSSVIGAVTGSGTFTVGGVAADGAAVSGNPARIAGKDGSGNTQDIITDTAGELQVDVLSIAAGDNNVGNIDIVTLPALSTGPIASNPRTDVGTSVATQLIVASTPSKKVTLVFDDGAATNGASGVMWVGGTSVAANNGIPLRAGQSLTLEVGNANTIWLFCTTASQKVTWVAEN